MVIHHPVTIIDLTQLPVVTDPTQRSGTTLDPLSGIVAHDPKVVMGAVDQGNMAHPLVTIIDPTQTPGVTDPTQRSRTTLDPLPGIVVHDPKVVMGALDQGNMAPLPTHAVRNMEALVPIR